MDRLREAGSRCRKGEEETNPEPWPPVPVLTPGQLRPGSHPPIEKQSCLFSEALQAACSPRFSGQPTPQGQGHRTGVSCPTVLCRAASLHQGRANTCMQRHAGTGMRVQGLTRRRESAGTLECTGMHAHTQARCTRPHWAPAANADAQPGRAETHEWHADPWQ